MSTEGVDYSTGRPDPTWLAHEGKRFAGRYLGAGSPAKHLTRREVEALTAAGLTIFSIVEGATGDATRGRGKGREHAALALTGAHQVGMPDDAPFYFAVDFQLDPDAITFVGEYFHGIRDVLPANRIGVYGGISTIDAADRYDWAQWFWQTYAWSGHQLHDAAHLYQYHNGVQVGGADCDLVRAIVPHFGQWDANGAPGTSTGGTMTTPDRDVTALEWRVKAIIDNLPAVEEGPTAGEPNRLAQAIATLSTVTLTDSAWSKLTETTTTVVAAGVNPIMQAIADLAARPLVDAVALAQALAANPDFVGALAAAVGTQLGQITGEVTLSGSLVATSRPGTP